jgi:hypothetical protein
MSKKLLAKISPKEKKYPDDIYDLIKKIADEHCKSNKKFGYLSKTDIKNEIWVICLEKLKDFDSERGQLEHFLRVTVKNRLINKFKDITKSVRSPCPRCPYFDPGESPSDCARFGDDRHLCSKWHNYELSVQSRNSLLNASEQQIERETKFSTLSKIYSDEIKRLILDNIDKNFAYDFNELISGGKISKQRLKKLKKEIFRILSENNYEETKFIQINVKNKQK